MFVWFEPKTGFCRKPTTFKFEPRLPPPFIPIDRFRLLLWIFWEFRTIEPEFTFWLINCVCPFLVELDWFNCRKLFWYSCEFLYFWIANWISSLQEGFCILGQVGQAGQDSHFVCGGHFWLFTTGIIGLGQLHLVSTGFSGFFWRYFSRWLFRTMLVCDWKFKISWMVIRIYRILRVAFPAFRKRSFPENKQLVCMLFFTILTL